MSAIQGKGEKHFWKQEITFPTNNIGIKKDGTAATKPRSKYSNSVKLCQFYHNNILICNHLILKKNALKCVDFVKSLSSNYDYINHFLGNQIKQFTS